VERDEIEIKGARDLSKKLKGGKLSGDKKTFLTVVI